MNITQLSIKRPSLIIVIFGLFTLLGIIGFRSLSYELMPDFNQPVVVKGFILPKEGIGFSNSQSIGIGNKPNFKKASFRLQSDLKINVKVIYL